MGGSEGGGGSAGSGGEGGDAGGECDPDRPYCVGDRLFVCSDEGSSSEIDCTLTGTACAFSTTLGLSACVDPGPGGGQTSPNEAGAHFLDYPLLVSIPVQNGWQYASPPNATNRGHFAVDFGSYSNATIEETVKQSVVVSPCAGYAMGSSQYNAGTGYGRFVLIRCDQVEANSPGRHYFVVLGHLDSFDPSIPTFVDRHAGASMCPDNATNVSCSQAWLRVATGAPVGRVGKEDTSWYHLHLEVFLGNYATKAPNRRDPYDLYKKTASGDSAEHYYTPSDSKWGGCGDSNLWRTCPPQPRTSDPCAGQDCSGNGTCAAGICVCTGGWTGSDCSIPPCPGGGSCSGHGSCLTPGVCTCTGSYSGTDCSTPPCTPNWSCNWSACAAGSESASGCVDQKSCGSSAGMPTTRSCPNRIRIRRRYGSSGQACGNPMADWDHCPSTDGTSCLLGQGSSLSYVADSSPADFWIFPLGAFTAGDPDVVSWEYSLVRLDVCYNSAATRHVVEPTDFLKANGMEANTANTATGINGWTCAKLGYIHTGAKVGLDNYMVDIYRNAISPVSTTFYQPSNAAGPIDACTITGAVGWFAWNTQ